MQAGRRNELRTSEAIIREVQVVPIRPSDGIVGFASLVLNNSLYLGSIAIVTRPGGGFRLLYPTRKVGGTNLDIFHPISRRFGDQVEQVVIAKYQEVTGLGN